MWARVFDVHDGDICVAVEWVDPDDGMHYIELWHEQGYEPGVGRDATISEPFDTLASGSLEDWGYEPYGFQSWQ